jgi:nucleoside-diphosphate-sugar epimerase
MEPEQQTIIVTGVSGNLGQRLLPHLDGFRVIGIDLRPPAVAKLDSFVSMDFGEESTCRQLTELIRESNASAVIHLAFVIDPQRTGVLDVDRMWQINVSGVARVMEAISVANRYGAKVSRFIFPSSVSAYGPETPGPVTEDHPLGAHTLPYAIHKMESDRVVQFRAEGLGECTTYMLRPHIFTGSTMQNYLVGALRGTPTGNGERAQKMRAEGKRLPLMLPFGDAYLRKLFQFVHVDDMARLISWLLRRKPEGNVLHVLNVAGRGGPVTLERAAQIANARIVRVPKFAAKIVLQKLWDWGVSAIPPEALPYMIGSYTMDIGRLKQMLNSDFEKVIRFTVEEALADSFTEPSSHAARA